MVLLNTETITPFGAESNEVSLLKTPKSLFVFGFFVLFCFPHCSDNPDLAILDAVHSHDQWIY